MMKIVFESRDELRIVDLAEVLYLKASHNYTDFVYADGRVKSELMNISLLEARIAETMQQRGIDNPFAHVGRSLLVNTNFVEVLSLKLQKIIFRTTPPTFINVSKALLRGLKGSMAKKLSDKSYANPGVSY